MQYAIVNSVNTIFQKIASEVSPSTSEVSLPLPLKSATPPPLKSAPPSLEHSFKIKLISSSPSHVSKNGKLLSSFQYPSPETQIT